MIIRYIAGFAITAALLIAQPNLMPWPARIEMGQDAQEDVGEANSEESGRKRDQ